MNPNTEEFEPVHKNTPDEWYKVNVGDECKINGILCKVRKITKKDIIVRPLNFNDIKTEEWGKDKF